VRVVAVMVFLLGIAADASADDIAPATRARAEELSAAARRKIDDASDWAGASDLFMQAYELTKQLPYLINVAVSLRKARLPHQSVATYRRCLAEGGQAVTPELRAQILADIDHITRESGQVTVRTAGAPAAIELDHRPVGQAAKDAPLLVLVATEGGLIHTLRASRDGFAPIERPLGQLRAGETIDVELEPPRIATTGNVRIKSVPDAAQLVLVGRGPLGAAPQSLALPPGDYYVDAKLPGYQLGHERVSVLAGRDHDVVFHLEHTPVSWWTRHKLKVYIAASVVVAGGAAFGAYELFKPEYDGTTITFP
jgi:hypothetical protein